MRYPLWLLLRSLPSVPAPYGQLEPQSGYVGYGLPKPQFSRRDNISSNTTSISMNIPTSTITVLTFVTPSPSGSPIPITSQSQTVTSYIPKLTACPISSSVSGSSFARRQLQPSAPTFHFPNLSTTAEPKPSCSVLYSPTVTPICYTTLTPLGDIPITVSDCTQSVAFKTDYGLYTPANATSPVVVPTTYIAPWDSVISGAPKGLVEASICPLNWPCTTLTETWYTQIFEAATTSVSTVDINTVVTGPQEILIPPSITLTIASSTPSTISISTTFIIPSAFASTIIIRDTYLSGAPTPTQSVSKAEYTTLYTTSTSTRYITLTTAASNGTSVAH